MGLLSTFSENVKRSPRFALMLGLLVYLMCLMVLVPLWLYLISLIFGLEMSELQLIVGGSVNQEANYPWIFRLIQAGNQLSTWGAAGWLMASMMQAPTRELGLTHQGKAFQIPLAMLVMLFALPLVQWLQLDADSFQLPAFLSEAEAWMKRQEDVFGQALLEVLGTENWGVLLVNLLIFAMIPAFCEEVFFRGFLQKQLGRMMKPSWAIVTQALIFSFIHFQFYGFFARAFLGGILGYLVYRSGSLWTGIAGHFVFNATSIFLAFLGTKYPALSGVDPAQEISFPWTVVLGSVMLVAGALYLFHRQGSAKPATEKIYE